MVQWKDTHMHKQTPLSPWLAQLKQERPRFALERDAETDVAVVGAGIAGVSTAYYLLTRTNARVLLIDAGRIAHGATGRNAGQLVSYFERPLTDMVKQFGLQMTAHAQAAVEGVWGQIEDIRRTCNLRTPVTYCRGYAGLSTEEQILEHLEELAVRRRTGLDAEPLLLSAAAGLLARLPEEHRAHVIEVPHSTLLSLLRTEDTQYVAVTSSRKGCANSALLCEEITAWMLANHGARLRVAEHAPVTRVTLGKESARLALRDGQTVKAGRVVLCTNGFENFEIVNEAGAQVDRAFHELVHGIIGYMAAYFEPGADGASAVSYYDRAQEHGDPYHYVTRRPYERYPDPPRGLLCIGGPERFLPDRAAYDPLAAFPADVEEELDRAVRRICRNLTGTADRAFLWHGLMGYTTDQIRRIGFEPRNPVLLYNLGCNGVGILPSIYGGKRIAQLLEGLHLPPSIFDPL